ncbi:MAG TPA: DUF4382 domain-containing protein [Polyangia bacterium]
MRKATLSSFRNLRSTHLGVGGFLLAGFLSACTADGSNNTGTALKPGQVELRLVDAPADEVTEIVVTITRVEAHVAGGGGWVVLGDKTATIDLLKLQGGTFAQLGVVQMPAGKVTQLRLYVQEDGTNYVTTPDGKQHPLTVPSGPQSGIKIKAGFTWPECGMGNMTIDFDGKKSIHVHPKGAGAGDEWILRPVVRLKSVQVSGDGCGMQPPVGTPDAGSPPVVPPADAGTPEPMNPPMTDAGVPPVVTMPPVMNPPPGEPCANVICDMGEMCFNGGCEQTVD